MHDHVRPQAPEIMEQIEGEAVVVVDQDDHGRPFSCPLKVLDAGLEGVKERPYCPRRAVLANRLASSAARKSAFALSTHSCCSDFGLESATMPAPACTYIIPSLIRAVRSTMQLSSSPAAEK